MVCPPGNPKASEEAKGILVLKILFREVCLLNRFARITELDISYLIGLLNPLHCSGEDPHAKVARKCRT